MYLTIRTVCIQIINPNGPYISGHRGIILPYCFLTSPVPRREIAPLAHEIRDDPVEGGALVPETSLPRAELSEVLCTPKNSHGQGDVGGKKKKRCHNVRDSALSHIPGNF